jgi:hypothetical protein
VKMGYSFEFRVALKLSSLYHKYYLNKNHVFSDKYHDTVFQEHTLRGARQFTQLICCYHEQKNLYQSSNI